MKNRLAMDASVRDMGKSPVWMREQLRTADGHHCSYLRRALAGRAAFAPLQATAYNQRYEHVDRLLRPARPRGGGVAEDSHGCSASPARLAAAPAPIAPRHRGL